MSIQPLHISIAWAKSQKQERMISVYVPGIVLHGRSLCQVKLLVDIYSKSKFRPLQIN
jgi:hypothetical protein